MQSENIKKMDPEQYKAHLELIEKLKQDKYPMDEKTLNEILKNARESNYDYCQPSLSESDLKLINEIDKTYKTGKYKTNKTMTNNILSRLSNDTKSWILSVTGIITLSALIYVVSHYETTMYVLLGICGLGIFGVFTYAVKQLIKMEVFNDYE